MECRTSTARLDGREGSQPKRNSRRLCFVRMLQRLWFERLWLPIWTVLSGHRLSVGDMIADIPTLLYSKRYTTSTFRTLHKPTSITELASTPDFRTCKMITTEARTRLIPLSTQNQRADNFHHTSSESEAYEANRVLVQMSTRSPHCGSEIFDTGTGTSLLVEALSDQHCMPKSRADASSVGLHQNDEADFLKRLQSIRSSADQNCPMYHLFSITGKHMPNNYDWDDTQLRIPHDHTSPQDHQSASLAVQVASLLCPRSLFVKEQSIPRRGTMAGSLLPVSLRPAVTLVQFGFTMPVLQRSINISVPEFSELPCKIKESMEDKHVDQSEGSLEDLEPSLSDTSEISTGSAEEHLSTKRHEKLDSVLAIQANGHNISRGYSPLSSSGTMSSSRGASSFDAPSSHTTLDSQIAQNQPSSHKRKRIDHRNDRKKENIGSGEESGSENPGKLKPRCRRPQQLLACPFHKRDPLKFCAQSNRDTTYQTCTNGFADTAKIIQHLKRSHKFENLICVRCFREFHSQSELTTHLRGVNGDGGGIECSIASWETIDEDKWLCCGSGGWTALKKLGKKSTHLTPEEYWWQIFRAIFPGHPMPSDPYCNRSSELTEVEDAGEAQTHNHAFPGEMLGVFDQSFHGRSAQEAMINNAGAFFNDQDVAQSLDRTFATPYQAYDTAIAQPTYPENWSGLESITQPNHTGLAQCPDIGSGPNWGVDVSYSDIQPPTTFSTVRQHTRRQLSSQRYQQHQRQIYPQNNMYQPQPQPQQQHQANFAGAAVPSVNFCRATNAISQYSQVPRASVIGSGSGGGGEGGGGGGGGGGGERGGQQDTYVLNRNDPIPPAVDPTAFEKNNYHYPYTYGRPNGYGMSNINANANPGLNLTGFPPDLPNPLGSQPVGRQQDRHHQQQRHPIPAMRGNQSQSRSQFQHQHQLNQQYQGTHGSH